MLLSTQEFTPFHAALEVDPETTFVLADGLTSDSQVPNLLGLHPYNVRPLTWTSKNGINLIFFSTGRGGGGFLNVLANFIFMLRLKGLYRNQETGKYLPSSIGSDLPPDRSPGSQYMSQDSSWRSAELCTVSIKLILSG